MEEVYRLTLQILQYRRAQIVLNYPDTKTLLILRKSIEYQVMYSISDMGEWSTDYATAHKPESGMFTASEIHNNPVTQVSSPAHFSSSAVHYGSSSMTLSAKSIPNFCP